MEQYGMKIRCTAFKKIIIFLWGINYNRDIDSEKEQVMAKVGRPPVEDKKYIKVGFRVTEAERDRLLAYCKKMNLTQAQVFKEALELLYKTKP
jgi:hypothetical protein